MSSIIDQVEQELAKARAKHPTPFHSPQEGIAVLFEEMDEAWEAIKDDDFAQACKEILQVAAMAVRYLQDLGNG